MARDGNAGENAAEHADNISVAQAYANQSAYCRANDATITARIVEAIAALLDGGEGGQFLQRIRDWTGRPLGDAVPLRSAGALHGLHLSGAAPELAPIYAGEPANDVAIIAEVLRYHGDSLLHWLDGPPQTNEAGRSSNFVAAMLWLANRGLPSRFECLEIGSSAGINLMIDRFAYDLGGVKIGPVDPVMSFAPQWRGPRPPDRQIEFAGLRGCDVAPLDLTDPAQAHRLKAYIWPEHVERFVRLEAAIAAARQRAPDMTEMGGADFVAQELAKPQAGGATRLIMHSIVLQYLTEAERQRIAETMEMFGARATIERPLAWISLEGDRDVLKHVLKVRYWPGGEDWTVLAYAHAHGAWIEWQVAD